MTPEQAAKSEARSGGGRLILICAATSALLTFPLLVLFLLRRGLDVSDTGYYYASLVWLDEITTQTTQFAVVWNLLPLADDILHHRIAVFVLISASAALMAIAAWRLAWPQAKADFGACVLWGAFGVSGAAGFYFWWLPDPSYNSIALTMAMALLGLSFRMISVLRAGVRLPVAEAVAAGGLLFALGLARQPTGLGLGLLLPVYIVAAARVRFRPTVKLLMLGMAGAISMAALLSLAVEPLPVTIDRMLAGLERRDVLVRDDTFQRNMRSLVKNQGDLWRLAPLLALVLFGAVAYALTIERKARWLRQTVSAIGALGVVGLFVGAYLENGGAVPLGTRAFAKVLLPVTAVTLLCGMAVGAVRALPRPRPGADLVHITPVLIFAQIAVVFGSTGNWLQMVPVYGVFTYVALALVVCWDGRWTWSPLQIGCFAALIATQIVVWVNMTQQPYRLPATLFDQTTRTEIRGGASILQTDASTHRLLTELAEAAEPMGPRGSRPYLIDLSGRMPLIAYHLSARPMKSPWILSGPPGAQAHFEQMIGTLNDAELSAAWLLDAPMNEFRFSPEPLERRGYDPGQYRVAAKAWSDYLGAEVLLLAPPLTSAETATEQE